MAETLARVSTHLLIPILFAVWLAHSTPKNRVEWAIDLSLFWSYCILIFLVGFWAELSYPLRYVPPILLLAATVWSSRRLRDAPSQPLRVGRTLVLSLLAGVLGFAALQAVLAQTPGGEPAASLAFPLRDGTYYTVNGGRHVSVNRFASVDSLRTALEVARMGSGGRLDTSTIPTVWSPCDGVVDAIREDGIYLRTREGDSPLEVQLWPLESLRVGVGDSVRVGTELGMLAAPAGGATLRIAASRSGTPAPIRFGRFYLARNALFRAPGQ